MKIRRQALPLLMGLLATAPALAQEEGTRPGAGAPFSIGDAYTQEPGQFQFEGAFGYERGRDGRDLFEPAPTLKYGLTDRLELSLGGAYGLGDSSSANQGGVSPGMAFRLLDQRAWMPTVAVTGAVDLPFGPGHGSVGTEWGAVASWVTGRRPGAWGLHLNATWLARPDPRDAERRHGRLFGGAVSHVLDAETVLVAAYVEESQDRGERSLRLVEAGFERQIGEETAIAFAAGAGLNDDSPRFRLRAVLKYGFSLGR